MRFVSALLIFACLLRAQAPIGFGTGTLGAGLLRRFDWYSATPSGCTPSSTFPAKMCVGDMPHGDGYYLTGWASSSSILPSGMGLPIVGSFTSGSTTNCAGNIGIFQLGALDWSNLAASYWYEINCMSGYGTAGDTPTGWKGHCISSTTDDGCTWKSRNVFVKGGIIYMPVERALEVGVPTVHDATFILSPDGGRHWCNPYSLWHGTTPGTCDASNWNAAGDAPTCGAPDATHPCTDASYTDSTHSSIMWKNSTKELTAWHAIQYGQDGSTLAGTGDGCDPNMWTCFFGSDSEGTLARVLNTDLPKLDPSLWWYYTCPTATESHRCPTSDAASWTHTFADRTQVVKPTLGSFQGMAYFRDFAQYVLGSYACLSHSSSCGDDGTSSGTGWLVAAKPEGPYTVVLSSRVIPPGSSTPSLAISSTVTSNPPHVLMGTVTSSKHSYVPNLGVGSAVFSQWDMVTGRPSPIGSPDVSPKYDERGGVWPRNSGLVISDSHAPGTIPRKDLNWAFDFYDHGGMSSNSLVVASINSFQDIANGSAVLMACHGPGFCADWNPGQGVTMQPYGASISNAGYSAYLVSAMNSLPQTVGIGASTAYPGGTPGLTPTNAPTPTQGNGTYTVAGMFQYNGGNNFWTFGNSSGSNTSVSLQSTSGANLELGWGDVAVNRWRINSGITLTPGRWYFIACTVQANGATPIAHMWMGISGKLVDQISGVSRASTGGSPTQTPNVAAAPLTMGTASSIGYGGLFVYGRALGQAEVGLMYQTAKAKMAARGATLQ